MVEMKPQVVTGAITLELHGYLAGLKINLPQAEDIEAGDNTLGKVLLEAGIPSAAVEKAVVNQHFVTMAYSVQTGDYITLYPLAVQSF